MQLLPNEVVHLKYELPTTPYRMCVLLIVHSELSNTSLQRTCLQGLTSRKSWNNISSEFHAQLFRKLWNVRYRFSRTYRRNVYEYHTYSDVISKYKRILSFIILFLWRGWTYDLLLALIFRHTNLMHMCTMQYLQRSKHDEK